MITFYGAPWCADCNRSKRLLEEHNVAFTYVNLETDSAAADIVVKLNGGNQSIPTIVFDDGSILTEPNNATLIEKLKSLSLIAA